MEKIFEALGYMVSEKKPLENHLSIQFLYIPNKDGSKRWIWPASAGNPYFLKFYNISNLKSKLIAFCIKLVFVFKLQRLFFKSQNIFYSQISDKQFFEMNSDWALFTGTAGPNNKAIVYVKKHDTSCFIKVALTEQAKTLLKHEKFVLNRLFYSSPVTFDFPSTVATTNDTLTLSDLSEGGRRESKLSDLHMNTLIELNEISSFSTPLYNFEPWKQLKCELELLETLDDCRIPKGMIRKLKDIIHSRNTDSKIEVSLCHGDFTPWNIYQNEEKLQIYDWELSQPFMPIGHDAFHFIMQQGILVERKNWKQIKKDIDHQLKSGNFKAISKFKNEDMEEYLQLYLLFNTITHLKLYAKQLKWHEQVFWMLNVWNDAITSFTVDIKTQRQLVIMDLFDFLADKRYAAIKFPGTLPEMLSEFSDIDLFIEKPLQQLILHYLENHPHVDHVSLKKSSFMCTQQIICNDGSIISLDLIWKMKRKNLELMDVSQALKNAYMNSYGIKMLELKDNIRYIGLFYLANGANIPSKFNAYEELLKRSDSPLDNLLFNYFIEEEPNKKPVLNFINKRKPNRGLSYFRNTIDYMIDVVKTALFNKGMIITFSGVDGAGKSTVIEKIKFKLEKQLRRRVIVLRHRPSLLPIISSYTKGKIQAEQDAAQSLPRMGNNTSTLSSLLRFGYYYTDYLFGQFVIYFKYISRGYVVLYDRYYYDFISDAKRSNVNLPSSFTKLGLLFLMKPKCNFFLYADPEIILERKKELSKETINSLTREYMSLFASLAKSNKAEEYKVIENRKLEDTLNNIFSSITHHAA